jgi:hypothetical protein
MSQKVKYTEKELEQLKAGYTPTASEEVRKAQVETLAADMNRKTASIRAKLSAMKLYVAAKKKSK